MSLQGQIEISQFDWTGPHNWKTTIPGPDFLLQTYTNGKNISVFVSVKFSPGSDKMYLIPQSVSGKLAWGR